MCVQSESVSGAILATLTEYGPMQAGELANAAAARLRLEAPAVREIKSEVWRMVAERRCLWNFDGLIELADGPSHVAVR